MKDTIPSESFNLFHLKSSKQTSSFTAPKKLRNVLRKPLKALQPIFDFAKTCIFFIFSSAETFITKTTQNIPEFLSQWNQKEVSEACETGEFNLNFLQFFFLFLSLLLSGRSWTWAYNWIWRCWWCNFVDSTATVERFIPLQSSGIRVGFKVSRAIFHALRFRQPSSPARSLPWARNVLDHRH